MQEESMLATGLQVFIAFLLAGFGNVGAGLILDRVKLWSSFVHVSELFVLVPSLLGLKGNLEMTMAARLSTQANLGNTEDWTKACKMAQGNLCLIQCQATVVAFLASIIAIAGTYFREGSEFNINEALILCSSSLITANIACFFLGICMISVITLSHRLSIDPDNIATPIAASLGDVTTLSLLAAFAQLIYNHTLGQTFPTLAVAIIAVFLLLLPFWFYMAYTNEYTRTVVTTGWTPVIMAMIISSAGGFILDYSGKRFESFALFQPVVNGVGGNLVAVQASRLSTFLHRQGKPGHMPLGYKVFSSPVRAFFSKKDLNVKTARILFLMAFPAHLLYITVIRFIEGSDKVQVTLPFLAFYILFALMQVCLLLYMAYNLVFVLWKKAIDPDNSAIPLLTALGDFLGSLFLLFAFMFLALCNDPNAAINDEPISADRLTN
ncbi:Solute carrier family 41 member 1 [Halotydeus destructor]|nr:Solute carrier family 41 member 1 [Halotydeus destructor]